MQHSQTLPGRPVGVLKNCEKKVRQTSILLAKHGWYSPGFEGMKKVYGTNITSQNKIINPMIIMIMIGVIIEVLRSSKVSSIRKRRSVESGSLRAMPRNSI